MTGGCPDDTVIACSQVVVFPHASVACQVRVIIIVLLSIV
jgi:hypothetical protein